MESGAASMSNDAASILAVVNMGLSIGDFLDISDLVNCERARIFSSGIFEYLWNVAALQWLESYPLWNKTVYEALGESGLHGKKLISKMMSFRRTVLPSTWWRPWITETALHSIKALPNLDDLFEGQIGDTGGAFSSRPYRASVAVAAGTKRGQILVIGMKFAAAGPVDDNLCIGLAAIGCNSNGSIISISFAPFSGRCFIEYDNKLTMQAQALPSSPEALEGYVWIQVTEWGRIRFFRQFKGSQLEDTGLLPRAMLPNCIESYFANIDIWLNDLEAAVDVSVEHSGYAFPISMSISNKDGAEMETTWTQLGGESW